VCVCVCVYVCVCVSVCMCAQRKGGGGFTEMKYHHHTYTAMKNENTRNFICNTQEKSWCSTSCIMQRKPAWRNSASHTFCFSQKLLSQVLQILIWFFLLMTKSRPKIKCRFLSSLIQNTVTCNRPSCLQSLQ
jgi:hypothetical protein